MKRRIVLAVLMTMALLPNAARAGVDTACSAAQWTSAINGTVKNAVGTPVVGIKVMIGPTNTWEEFRYVESALTNSQGKYKICAGSSSGTGHNTYDVRAKDESASPLYAAADQPYTTFTSPAQNADFTPESGIPLLYMNNVTISPREISTKNGPATVTWTVRSKAPSTTVMKLTLQHLNAAYTLPAPVSEGGGPAAGGWNRWTYTTSLALNSPEQIYSATAVGTTGSTQTTQLGQDFYTVDNSPPQFGPKGQASAECGPGPTAPAFAPAAPLGTTNQRPITTYGVCDSWSGGARSGLDPFTITATMCTNIAMTAGCSTIEPVLSVYSMIWFPNAPLAFGDYWIQYTAADKAGNTKMSTPQNLHITETGGQVPVFSALSPGNLGSGDPRGIIAGSQFTSPSSFPVVGFRLSDADGQDDLSPGSLRVRIYYMNESNLVYDYDPTLSSTTKPNAITKKAGGAFDIYGGLFRATGMPLQITDATPPGRYIASASITDRGGNNSTISWHWFLVAAL